MSEPDSANPESTARSRTFGQSSGNSSDGPAPPEAGPLTGWDGVKEHISSHKIDFILAVTRFLTISCTLSYLIGFPYPSSNRYKQALLLNAATSSLRLHQRTPPPPMSQLSRTYFMNLIREDSFHYLIFPFMFLTGQPLTLVLLPCALYAVFNLAVYAITILEKLDRHHQLRLDIANFVTKYQKSLLHTIALSEVALMPIVAVSVFARVVNILVPIFYYRFLLLRYNSVRNAHLKLLVSQIRVLATTYVPSLSRFLGR